MQFSRVRIGKVDFNSVECRLGPHYKNIPLLSSLEPLLIQVRHNIIKLADFKTGKLNLSQSKKKHPALIDFTPFGPKSDSYEAFSRQVSLFY